MARIEVYLPDELYEQVKARGLPASELFQKAVRTELRRMELLAETDRYVADLVAEVGPPTEGERGEFAERFQQGANLVLLDPEVAKAFPDAQAVNDALRLVIQLAQIPGHPKAVAT